MSYNIFYGKLKQLKERKMFSEISNYINVIYMTIYVKV